MSGMPRDGDLLSLNHTILEVMSDNDTNFYPPQPPTPQRRPSRPGHHRGYVALQWAGITIAAVIFIVYLWRIA